MLVAGDDIHDDAVRVADCTLPHPAQHVLLVPVLTAGMPQVPRHMQVINWHSLSVLAKNKHCYNEQRSTNPCIVTNEEGAPV